ncbi:MAG TPA: hypothetical protein PKV27_04175 [Ilumatobacteraceae bacterium]|nr:hypothetical protein [Ilumatobacteraceae bacterium]
MAASRSTNEKLLPGRTWVRVRYRATFNGGDNEGSPTRINMNIADPSNVTYKEGWVCCEEHDKLSSQGDTFVGGVVEGWVYYQVPEDVAGGPFIAFDSKAPAAGFLAVGLRIAAVATAPSRRR